MIRRPAAILASLGLVVVWGSAAFLKSLDPAAFADQITQHRVTPAAWSPVLAWLFIVAETSLAAAHLSFVRPRLAFAGSTLLLLLFVGVTFWAWAHGNAEGCGCFGRLASRPPLEVILEDAAFLSLAVGGFFLARGFRPPRRSPAVFAALLPLAIVLPLVGPRLPADALVTTFNPGQDLSHLAAEDLPVLLGQGEVLLVLISDSCPACEEGLPRLNEIAGTEGAPAVVAVFAGSRREARAWSLARVPAFGVASAPVKVLRQYYRRLPQVALLENGVVRKVWRNRIPGRVEVQAAGVTPG